jgi:hypothetical protein
LFQTSDALFQTWGKLPNYRVPCTGELWVKTLGQCCDVVGEKRDLQILVNLRLVKVPDALVAVQRFLNLANCGFLTWVQAADLQIRHEQSVISGTELSDSFTRRMWGVFAVRDTGWIFKSDN